MIVNIYFLVTLLLAKSTRMCKSITLNKYSYKMINTILRVTVLLFHTRQASMSFLKYSTDVKCVRLIATSHRHIFKYDIKVKNPKNAWRLAAPRRESRLIAAINLAAAGRVSRDKSVPCRMPPGNAFYDFILSMWCHLTHSGYVDGFDVTFLFIVNSNGFLRSFFL